jgi:hypothetical protein
MMGERKTTTVIENCAWCHGHGVAWADCGDKGEPQKCDSCAIYESDSEALQALDSDIRLRRAIGVPENIFQRWKWENNLPSSAKASEDKKGGAK